MRRIDVSRESLVLSAEMTRTAESRQFEERLAASIEEIGLAEPIKVASLPDGGYLVVDGMLRLRAIDAIRAANPTAFPSIPAYLVDYSRRYELRFQTDIYQDLLPSQLAAMVEHLHQTENIKKSDIARYIGVSPPTVRNYTGLWRLLQRGGLFANIVELMDVGVIPSSNPYAWLRLSDDGIRLVIEGRFSEDWEEAESWIAARITNARKGQVEPFSIKFVEAATTGLLPNAYREDEEVRTLKRDLGLRRAGAVKSKDVEDTAEALAHLGRVISQTPDPFLRNVALALSGYLT